MRQVDARIGLPEIPTELNRQWREARGRTNAISDLLGLPRVIEVAAAARPAGKANRNLVAQVDRAVAELDERLVDLQKTRQGSPLQDDYARLRLMLLQFRQRVLAKDSSEPLSRSLREIETLNRRLREPAGIIFRGGQAPEMVRGPNPAQTISKLRGLLMAH
jgi:hypothetical protein